MNHSSIPQIHLNGGENSLSGGEHSIRIYSPASASSSASSFLLLSKALIGRRREKKKKKKSKNGGSGNRCAVWKAAAIFWTNEELISDQEPRSKSFKGFAFISKKKRKSGDVDSSLGLKYNLFFCAGCYRFSFFFLLNRAAPGLSASPHPHVP